MNGLIAPELLAIRRDYEREKEYGHGRDFSPYMFSRGLYLMEGSYDPPRTAVFLSCGKQTNFNDLGHNHNIRVNQNRGRIRTALLPFEELEILAEYPGVDYISPSYRLRYLLDKAIPRVGIKTYQDRTNRRGNGVIIGIIDSGIDANHQAFNGRILSVWDQTIPGGQGVNEGQYGKELTGNDILCARDEFGHGTHVAGIAAGDDLNYCGVAPKANLVIVKSDLLTTNIADGIRYIFRIAEADGKPAVINISLSGHNNPHDGLEEFSTIINDESGSGKIICCAAGNEGYENIHAQARVPERKQCSIQFRIPSYLSLVLYPSAILNCWYSGNDHIKVAVQSPSGFRTPFQSENTTNPISEYEMPGGIVRIITPGPDFHNGDHHVQIYISSNFKRAQIVEPGIWQLILEGQEINEKGIFDAWALDGPKGNFDVFFTCSNNMDSIKIGSPGAAREAITVASYTTKVEWTDYDQNKQEIGWNKDAISPFSSKGPLRNGEKKPDVAAPGAYIVSSLSSNFGPLPVCQIDNEHLAMCGTSMATPIISGIVACLLEGDKDLYPKKIKDILRANSRNNQSKSNIFDPKAGYGLIDATSL